MEVEEDELMRFQCLDDCKILKKVYGIVGKGNIFEVLGKVIELSDLICSYQKLEKLCLFWEKRKIEDVGRRVR